MAPSTSSTPRTSLPTVTPGASAYRPDPEPAARARARARARPGARGSPPWAAYISRVYEVGRSPGPKGGSWRGLGAILWFLLQAEVAASRAPAEG